MEILLASKVVVMALYTMKVSKDVMYQKMYQDVRIGTKQMKKRLKLIYTNYSLLDDIFHV
ncbi:Protein of unknown function [Cotesia congregata]|uniref:Uncharacterized protein n=1 Tax=Cotesia congregata TaxID=51543 RepID=A0A8J2HII4_COTCN|nr:Protein of unknown function [Cotesia congregata]